MKPTLNERDLLQAASRAAWRAWLRKHYKSEKEVWLVFHKKHTGKPNISYNDAVEEALCFGWIDSTVRRLDQDRYAQRFSVRRARSSYSQANQERLKSLVAQGKVAAEVLAVLPDLSPNRFDPPADILQAIRANSTAWKNFRKFPQPYIRIRLAFIEGARKRPKEFQKRLSYFIVMTEKNKLFGFGGIEKHYR
jgi:uncharacterized protein YdeI (YjbR/CyaY-like superfamily)